MNLHDFSIGTPTSVLIIYSKNPNFTAIATSFISIMVWLEVVLPFNPLFNYGKAAGLVCEGLEILYQTLAKFCQELDKQSFYSLTHSMLPIYEYQGQ